MPKKIAISKFFQEVGFPLRAVRWSWGAQHGKAMLLRVWADGKSADGRFVQVLGKWEGSNGLSERVRQLAELERGGVAGYVVVAKAKDLNAHPRVIEDYEEDVVHEVKRLVHKLDGRVWAELGATLAPTRIAAHSKSFRTESWWDVGADEGLTGRLERFARAQVRPEQRLFRERVFKACRGRCVVSQCSIPEVLEAAHMKGRSWKNGHNARTDGVLLRRDLHALYDNELLWFGKGGRVEFASQVAEEYPGLSGVVVKSDFYWIGTNTIQVKK